MNTREAILKEVASRGEVRTRTIVRTTGVSRAFVHRILQQLEREGKLRLVGKANQARYVLAEPESIEKALASVVTFHAILHNRNLEEGRVFARIKAETGILRIVPANILRIVEYGFTEMLNNAIEHSQSPTIDVRMARFESVITFSVIDRGIGILRNIMQTRNLTDEHEAIQDLLKGKLTTMPARHSGEGVFFTSKVADGLVIRSSDKKILFDNILPDVFLRTVRPRRGTQVDFWIALESRREIAAVFRQFTGEDLVFDKTRVGVAMFKVGSDYVSRSQARRLVAGLEEFNEIELDFARVEDVGQAFADEVFRVWRMRHPEKVLRVTNASQDVQFMISRAMALSEQNTHEQGG